MSDKEYVPLLKLNKQDLNDLHEIKMYEQIQEKRDKQNIIVDE